LGGDKTSPLRFLFTRQPRRASVTDTHLRPLSAGSPLHRRQYISCAWYRCPTRRWLRCRHLWHYPSLYRLKVHSPASGAIC